MIIALDIAFSEYSLDYPRLELANHGETPMEQDVSIVAPFRKCNLIVSNDYVKRLSILGFSNYSPVSSGSESLRGGSTIPMKDTTWPLNGREV